jgi:hypothetical protein
MLKGSAYKVLVRKIEGQRPLEELGINGRILKSMLKNRT